MQNTDEVFFTILWKQVSVSKLLMMLIVTIFGFIIGVIVARPRKKKVDPINHENQKNVPLEITDESDEEYISMKKPNQLSDEDKNYID